MQQPAQRNGQHKNIDQQEVKREEPDRPPQVRFIDILDDDDLELSRQQDDRQSGEQDQRSPTASLRRIKLQQSAQFRRGSGPLENVRQTAKNSVRHEQSDGEEGHQLDHRLEGNRRHHPLVPLGGVEMPGTEEHREQGQRRRNQQGRIQPPREDAGFDLTKQDRQAGRHGLQLQCDVGHDANDRDYRHQSGEQLALAVTRGDEVGNRGNAVGLADAQHLDQDADEQQHQRRTNIDGQEGEPARRRSPDTAVKSP